MIERRVVVRLTQGVHARPVAEIVCLANGHDAPITLTTAGGATVDLRSILSVMSLDLGPGDAVVLRTTPSESADGVLGEVAAVLDPS